MDSMKWREFQEDRVLRDRLDSLFSTFKTSAPATVLAAALYIYMEHGSRPVTLLAGWAAALGAVLGLRLVLLFLYQRSTTRDLANLRRWLHVFRLGVFLTGAVFGSLGFLFYPTDSQQLQMISIIILTGGAAVALTTLAADTVSFILYVTGFLGPLTVMSIVLGGRLNPAVAALMGIFLVVIIRAGKKVNDIVISSLHLQYENLSLVADLKEEKSRLDNRLGRILNDSLSELYILNAKTLACVQVNNGAVGNSGYSREELEGRNFLDIVVTLDRSGFDTLTKPLRQGSRESVTCEGIQRRRDGSTYPVEINLQLSTSEEPPVFVATCMDITRRREAEEKLMRQANYDQLTDLPNRHFMVPFIEKACRRAERNNTLVALLFLDLNNFKDVNDAYGHATGDNLLRMAAGRLRDVLRTSDTPARIGGDEFLIVLEDFTNQNQVEGVVAKVIDCFKRPFPVDNQEMEITACIGISIYPHDGHCVDLLMQYANTAMYAAKDDTGRCRFRFFSRELRKKIEEQLRMKNCLQHALENDELRVFYQPKVDVKRGIVVGAEALLRWSSPELGDVPPFLFIPVAEKYGLIERIGAWVMAEACREAATWQTMVDHDVHIAVNVSPQQFRSGKLLSQVDSALARSGLPAGMLEVEITESLLVRDSEEPLAILNGLQRRGIKLSLDDFGTGYSSLSYLKRFPLQVLKIDRSFIFDLLENHYNRALVEAIITMANSLELELVAEGVETDEQLEFLRQRMVRIVQGYLFSKPVPAAEFRDLLESFTMETALPAL